MIDHEKIIGCWADEYYQDGHEDSVLEDWVMFLDTGGWGECSNPERGFTRHDWHRWITTTQGFIEWADEEVAKDLPNNGYFMQERISNADDRSVLGLEEI